MGVLLAFLALPIVEIALFIIVGDWIGLWPTLALVLGAAVAGLAVVRSQGAQAFKRLRKAVAADADPTGPMAHSAMLVLAGVLLMIPGFFTDALALLLLLPPVRHALIRRLRARASGRTVIFASGFPGGSADGRGPVRPRGPAETIEADYEVLDDVPPAERGASGWTRRPN